MTCRFSGTLPVMNRMVQIIDLKIGSNSLSGHMAETGRLETLRFLSVEVYSLTRIAARCLPPLRCH